METSNCHDEPNHNPMAPLAPEELTPTANREPTTDNKISTENKKEECVTSPSQEATRDQVFKSYQKQAQQEDKLLVERWSKTCDVLLLFSALLSAIIVAFVIFAETSNDDARQTNALLQSILYRLDNSTTTPPEPQQGNGASSVSTLASSCWYVSLACSILAAFGSLLSKQWLMHYISHPSWADSTSLRCRLRELRHEGYQRWKVDWFMDSLVMLLQSSVLAFAIGVAAHVNTTSRIHLRIVFSSTLFGAVVFGITLITGTLVPGCPFKSSITESFYRILKVVGLSIIIIPLACMVMTAKLLSITHCARLLPVWLTKLGRDAETLMNLGCTTIEEVAESGSVEYEALREGHAGLAGVICWWLVQEGYKHNEDGVDTKQIVEEVFSFLKWVVIDLFVLVHPFTSWSSRVVNGLRSVSKSPPSFTPELRPSSTSEQPSPSTSESSSSSTNSHIEMGDVLCHLMHDNWLVRNIALRSAKSAALNCSEEFCSILRKAWCTYKDSSVLPVSSIPRWPTISLYLQLQFASWSDLYDQKDKGHHKLERDQLEQDLSAIMHDPRLEGRRDVGNALALTTLVLVDRVKSNSGLDWTDQVPYSLRQAQRFIKALDLLSNYPLKAPAEEFVVLAAQASANYFMRHLGERDGFFAGRYHWWNDELPGVFIRLLNLGESWHSRVAAGLTVEKGKEAEDGAQVRERIEVELGEKLVNEAWRILSGVAAYLNTQRTIAPTWYTLSDENDTFKAIVQWCCDRPTDQSHSLHKFQVLAFILRLRCTPSRRATWRFPWADHELPPDSVLEGVRAGCKRAVVYGITAFKDGSDVRRSILSLLSTRRTFFFDITSLIEKSLNRLRTLEGQLLVEKENAKKETRANVVEQEEPEREKLLRENWNMIHDALVSSGGAAPSSA